MHVYKTNFYVRKKTSYVRECVKANLGILKIDAVLMENPQLSFDRFQFHHSRCEELGYVYELRIRCLETFEQNKTRFSVMQFLVRLHVSRLFTISHPYTRCNVSTAHLVFIRSVLMWHLF